MLYKPNGEYKVFTGKTFGEITYEELGCKDFGYDCIFYSKDLKKTFGEASKEEKNSVSHRGRALKELLNGIEDSNNNERVNPFIVIAIGIFSTSQRYPLA